MLLVFSSRFETRFNNKLACASHDTHVNVLFMSLPNTILRSVVTVHISWKSTMEPTLVSIRDILTTLNLLLEVNELQMRVYRGSQKKH